MTKTDGLKLLNILIMVFNILPRSDPIYSGNTVLLGRGPLFPLFIYGRQIVDGYGRHAFMHGVAVFAGVQKP